MHRALGTCWTWQDPRCYQLSTARAYQSLGEDQRRLLREKREELVRKGRTLPEDPIERQRIGAAMMRASKANIQKISDVLETEMILGSASRKEEDKQLMDMFASSGMWLCNICKTPQVSYAALM